MSNTLYDNYQILSKRDDAPDITATAGAIPVSGANLVSAVVFASTAYHFNLLSEAAESYKLEYQLSLGNGWYMTPEEREKAELWNTYYSLHLDEWISTIGLGLTVLLLSELGGQLYEESAFCQSLEMTEAIQQAQKEKNETDPKVKPQKSFGVDWGDSPEDQRIIQSRFHVAAAVAGMGTGATLSSSTSVLPELGLSSLAEGLSVGGLAIEPNMLGSILAGLTASAVAGLLSYFVSKAITTVYNKFFSTKISKVLLGKLTDEQLVEYAKVLSIKAGDVRSFNFKPGFLKSTEEKAKDNAAIALGDLNQADEKQKLINLIRNKIDSAAILEQRFSIVSIPLDYFVWLEKNDVAKYNNFKTAAKEILKLESTPELTPLQLHEASKNSTAVRPRRANEPGLPFIAYNEAMFKLYDDTFLAQPAEKVNLSASIENAEHRAAAGAVTGAVVGGGAFVAYESHQGFIGTFLDEKPAMAISAVTGATFFGRLGASIMADWNSFADLKARKGFFLMKSALIGGVFLLFVAPPAGISVLIAGIGLGFALAVRDRVKQLREKIDKTTNSNPQDDNIKTLFQLFDEKNNGLNRNDLMRQLNHLSEKSMAAYQRANFKTYRNGLVGGLMSWIVNTYADKYVHDGFLYALFFGTGAIVKDVFKNVVWGTLKRAVLWLVFSFVIKPYQFLMWASSSDATLKEAGKRIGLGLISFVMSFINIFNPLAGSDYSRKRTDQILKRDSNRQQYGTIQQVKRALMLLEDNESIYFNNEKQLFIKKSEGSQLARDDKERGPAFQLLEKYLLEIIQAEKTHIGRYNVKLHTTVTELRSNHVTLNENVRNKIYQDNKDDSVTIKNWKAPDAYRQYLERKIESQLEKRDRTILQPSMGQ